YTPGPSNFGRDYFTFKAQDPQGNLSVEDTVFVGIVPRLDPGDVLVIDQNMLRLFDPVTHKDTILSKNQGLSQGLNLAYKPGTSIFAFDKLTGLIKINPVTGDQSMVAARSGFAAGGPIGGAPGMLIDNSGKIVVADGTGGIKRVDTITGAITTLFSGGSLQYPTGVTYLNNGDLIVSDAGLMTGGASKVIRINPGGVQTVVSSNATIKVPLDLALIDQNTVVICDAGSFGGGTDNVYKINLATGALTVLSTGGSISIPSGLDFQGGKLYVVNNNGTRKILDIDNTTGAQTILTGSSMTQPWGLMVVPSGVPVTKTVQNVTIINGQSTCYNASHTITVAGGGTTFAVQNGGSAIMVAGVNILYEPGTTISNGGYMHGYIASGGPYCYTPSLPNTVTSAEDISFSSAQSLFKVYPNPTSGNFTIEQKGNQEYREGKVEVYAMRGEKVMTSVIAGEKQHEYMFSEMPPGLYFIKVMAGGVMETFKLIKTR
ncbi:MAG: T9SS type A sorting domain-containing protein, partial [Bacteroidota bacterium]